MNYIDVNWTNGDTITEAKMDNMVGNDRAEDAHSAGIVFVNATGKVQFRDSGGLSDGEIYEDANGVLQFVQGAGGFAGLDIALATQVRGNIAQAANQAQFPPATRDFTIQEVFVQVAADGTQAAGQMTFDVNLNGTTIWATQGNRLKLAASTARGTQTTPDTVDVNKYDNFSLDVDVTDTTAKNLLFVIIGI